MRPQLPTLGGKWKKCVTKPKSSWLSECQDYDDTPQGHRNRPVHGLALLFSKNSGLKKLCSGDPAACCIRSDSFWGYRPLPLLCSLRPLSPSPSSFQPPWMTNSNATQASSESAPLQRPHTLYLAGWLTARLTRWGSKRWASVELKRDPHALVFMTLLLTTKHTPSKILLQRLSLFWMCFMNQTSTASTCLCIEYRRNKAASVSNLIIISLRLLTTSCKITVC